MRILITGGHLTPALALIDEIKTQNLPWTVIFAGREFAQLATAQPSYEAVEIKRRQLDFINFEAVKTGSFQLGKFSGSVKNAKKILQNQKIDLVFSFGGYLALPFALAARYLRLPVLTHEQTRVLGSANHIIALLAKKVAVSFPDTKVWPASKLVLTGNPLRQEIFNPRAKAPTWFHSQEDERPWLYISGGSQGCKAINEAVAQIMDQLLEKFIVIHQAGASSDKRNPIKELESFYSSKTPLSNSKNYYPREFLSVSELAFFYPRLSLALGRAGANTVAELSAFRIPTLYVPLPFSNHQEQLLNARYQEQLGAAQVMLQDDLGPETLLTALKTLSKRAPLMKKPQQNTSFNLAAADKLITLIKNIYAQKSHSEI